MNTERELAVDELDAVAGGLSICRLANISMWPAAVEVTVVVVVVMLAPPSMLGTICSAITDTSSETRRNDREHGTQTDQGRA
jgi:hypothetical protein